MFNFPQNDRRDRLLLRVADSKWSKPMSFDSPAADMAVVMQSARNEKEMHVGLSYSEGLGKVRLANKKRADELVQIDKGCDSYTTIHDYQQFRISHQDPTGTVRSDI